MQVTQYNLQRHLGGGETYTAFLCRALDQLGVMSQLFVHERSDFWGELILPQSTKIIPITSPKQLAHSVNPQGGWLLGHGPLPPEVVAHRARNSLATAIAHMPVQDQGAKGFAGHDRVFAVSQWVLHGLRQAEVPTWECPIYCVADLSRKSRGQGIVQTSRYAWDHRKARDRVMGWLEPFANLFRSRLAYSKRSGLTLGIVSRITPIKQFPLMFKLIVPILLRYPDVNLEIFGSGGYASIRDLRHVLAPLGHRVRWWGHQANVSAAYASIDYLLTGLPEKEAMPLNIVEAQACGTPILAVHAAPFTESILDGVSGYFFTDPREDSGADFDNLLKKIQRQKLSLDPRVAREHLDKFSFDGFVERLKPVVNWVRSELR